MKGSFIKLQASFFAFLGILFIPFPFYLLKVQSAVTDFIFGNLIGFAANNIFSRQLKDTHVYSDSVSMYILILLLFLISFIITLLLWRNYRWLKYQEKAMSFFYQLFVYYVVLQLLKYGADKIFKNQFYLPEPNTLYTPLGNISKDLLYWSSMGSSRLYTIFLGAMEVIAAIFILLRKTRLIGLLMSCMILLNIIIVNFGFDISVKLYSLFLFFLSVYLLSPYIVWLWEIVKKKTFVVFNNKREHLLSNRFTAGFVKFFITGLIFLEVFYPFVKAGSFNGDIAIKPYLHGAYEVKQVIIGSDTLPVSTSPVRRFFIHNNGYMIFQDQQDEMVDYKLSYDTATSLFVLTDYQLNKTKLSFTFNPSDSILILQYLSNGKQSKLTGKAIDWRQMPLLQKTFHWTVDGN